MNTTEEQYDNEQFIFNLFIMKFYGFSVKDFNSYEEYVWYLDSTAFLLLKDLFPEYEYHSETISRKGK